MQLRSTTISRRNSQHVLRQLSVERVYLTAADRLAVGITAVGQQATGTEGGVPITGYLTLARASRKAKDAIMRLSSFL